jgi:hypothetical protein
MPARTECLANMTLLGEMLTQSGPSDASKPVATSKNVQPMRCRSVLSPVGSSFKEQESESWRENGHVHRVVPADQNMIDGGLCILSCLSHAWPL